MEDSLLELNKIEAPSLRGDRQSGDESWWKDGEESSKDGWSSGSQDSVRSPQKSHSTSFFSSKSKSSERIVFDTANIDESVHQFRGTKYRGKLDRNFSQETGKKHRKA